MHEARRRNLGIAVVALTLGLTIGLGEFVMIELPIMLIGSVIGFWTFHIHHLSPKIPNYHL